MRIPSSSSLIVIIIPLAILLHPHVISGADDFIRTSCQGTRYPDVCYSSLGGYASNVQQNEEVLVTLALKVSLANVKELYAYTLKLSHTSSNNDLSDRVHDCVSYFLDAASQIRDSIRQLKELDRSGTESIRLGMSNIQTWMSSALTNEGSCVDGFDEVQENGEGLKKDVCDRTTNVNKITSNALSLVNTYTTKLTTH